MNDPSCVSLKKKINHEFLFQTHNYHPLVYIIQLWLTHLSIHRVCWGELGLLQDQRGLWGRLHSRVTKYSILDGLYVHTQLHVKGCSVKISDKVITQVSGIILKRFHMIYMHRRV